MKFQIAADWKYIIGDKEAAMRMKNESMKLFKQSDKLKRYELCCQEQKELIRILAGEKIDTVYVRKLIFIRQIM